MLTTAVDMGSTSASSMMVQGVMGIHLLRSLGSSSDPDDGVLLQVEAASGLGAVTQSGHMWSYHTIRVIFVTGAACQGLSG